jgi:23S rRNA pseudouridine1911/1915/1917 synthase
MVKETITKGQRLTATIPPEMAGMRLDQALAALFPQYSRARHQHWIRDGQVTVNDLRLRPRDILQGGESVAIDAVPGEETPWEGESIPLDIVYEDEALFVINKPPGMVAHPGAGNHAGTLLNALLGHAPELTMVPRAGIVHRLDKDTSGLIVVARTLAAHKKLVDQLQARSLKREYEAIVTGVMTAGATIDAPIGRHPVHRTRMAVTDRGKSAVTHYRVIERFRAHTHVRVRLESGRTHQIRVHMAYIHHPVVGDPLYGGRFRIPKGSSETLIDTLRLFKRQALHAIQLGLQHPLTGNWQQWEAPLPPDMNKLLAVLEADRNDAVKTS